MDAFFFRFSTFLQLQCYRFNFRLLPFNVTCILLSLGHGKCVYTMCFEFIINISTDYHSLKHCR